MNCSRRLVPTALLLILRLSVVQALEIQQDGVKVVLHEGIGRFSLYHRSYDSGERFTPLFVDQDPRTSGLSLVVNNKIFKLGDTAEFSEEVEKSTPEGPAHFQWQSKTLGVIQEFEIVTDGVKMSIRITNLTRSELSVGVRLCLDTYLGEENLAHFSTDRHQEIRGELSITKANMIRYWISASSQAPGQPGLKCITSGPGITAPDRIVFANWKRLSDASWGYETSANRNFNLMPYSINDSAVCMYYDPQVLPAYQSREIILVLGSLTVDSSGAIAAETAPAAEAASAAETAPAAETSEPETLQALYERAHTEAGQDRDLPLAVQRDLDLLNSLLEMIDEKLSAGEEVSLEDIRLMEQILSDIKDRSERYSGAH